MQQSCTTHCANTSWTLQPLVGRLWVMLAPKDWMCIGHSTLAQVCLHSPEKDWKLVKASGDNGTSSLFSSAAGQDAQAHTTGPLKVTSCQPWSFSINWHLMCCKESLLNTLIFYSSCINWQLIPRWLVWHQQDSSASLVPDFHMLKLLNFTWSHQKVCLHLIHWPNHWVQ